MFCQVCQREMPFRKRDGKHYFEAVECFTELGKEHPCLYLALCPLCAAKYKEFVKREPQAPARFRAAIAEATLLLVPIRLGDEQATVRFVQKHLLDLRTSLQHCGDVPEIVDGQSSDGTTSNSIASATEGGIVENALQRRLRQLKEQQTATEQPEAGSLTRRGARYLALGCPAHSRMFGGAANSRMARIGFSRLGAVTSSRSSRLKASSTSGGWSFSARRAEALNRLPKARRNRTDCTKRPRRLGAITPPVRHAAQAATT